MSQQEAEQPNLIYYLIIHGDESSLVSDVFDQSFLQTSNRTHSPSVCALICVLIWKSELVLLESQLLNEGLH